MSPTVRHAYHKVRKNTWKNFFKLPVSAGRVPRESCLESVKTGFWQGHTVGDNNTDSIANFVWQPLANPSEGSTASCQLDLYTPQTARQCLRDKWVYLIGDSSTRMLFSALVQLVNDSSTLTDPYFPNHRFCRHCESKTESHACCQAHVKGLNWNGEADEEAQGSQGSHDRWSYHREWTKFGTRIVFSFKTFADVPVSQAFQSQVTPSQQPDLLILQFGAWDIYHNHDLGETVAKGLAYIDHVKMHYSNPLVWLSLVECEPFRNISMAFNLMMEPHLQHLGIAYFSRSATTRDLPNNMQEQCEGFHAWDRISDEHVQWLLRAVCPL